MTGAIRSRLTALPAGLRGMAWMSAASFFFAMVYVAIRRLSQTVPIEELVLLRAVMGIAVMSPWLLREGLAALKTVQPGMHIGRIAFSYSGMICWFYALANMPLANATSLMFLLPIFTVLLAAAFLGERVGWLRWGATLGGFAGALIIIRPGLVEVSLAAGAALYTALSYAAANTMTKSILGTETPNAVVFYGFAGLAVVSAGPAVAVWQTPAWQDVSWIGVFGLLSAVAAQCITRSLAAAPASVVIPFQFLKLPFVAVVALAWFGEGLDPWTWLGALVIFASTYAIVRREAAGVKAAATASDRPAPQRPAR